MLEVGTSIFLLSRRLLDVTRPGATTSPNPDFTLGVRLNLWSAHSLVVLWLALHVAECPLCGAIWLGGTGRELLLLGVRRNLVKDMVEDEPIFILLAANLEGESVWVSLLSLLLLMLVSVSAW